MMTVTDPAEAFPPLPVAVKFPHALEDRNWTPEDRARGFYVVNDKLALAEAFDALEAWISKAPGERSCWVIDRLAGKWRVGLQSGDERYTASQDAELRGAIRNALGIAKLAGCL